MVETIGRFEERAGPLDDGRELRQIPTGTPSQRLTARNLALAQRLGVIDAARQALRAARWGALLLGAVALLSGVLAARGVLGDGTVNVNLLWALLGLLGLHGVALLAWLVSLPLSRRLHGVPARALVWLAQWRQRASASRSDPARPAADQVASRTLAQGQLAPALLAVLQRAGLLQPLAGLASHVGWLLALLAAWLTAVVLFATRQYGFTWETTLLDPQAFIGLTEALGQLPGLFGLAQPAPDLVARTVNPHTLGAADQAAWSRWLLACLLVYGVLPRLLLAVACAAWAWQRRHAVQPDFMAAGLAVQLARLQAQHQALGVTDPAPATVPDTVPAVALPGDRGPRPAAWQQPSQVLGLDLPDDLAWPPPDVPAHYADAGNLVERGQRNAVLAAYAEHAPHHLLIVIDARQTPDRGALSTLRELQHRVPGARLRLCAPAGSGSRLPQWQERLRASGIPLEAEAVMGAHDAAAAGSAS